MFEPFFFLLRAKGVPVSLNEWMTLTEALDMGLGKSGLTGFYYLSRSILVKTESNFDKFDAAFLEYFKDMQYTGEIPDELMEWLSHPEDGDTEYDMGRAEWLEHLSLEDMEKMLAERIDEQTEEHNGGDHWVGTRGVSPFGNNGASRRGIRVGGQSRHHRALAVAGERKFRDWSDDNTLDTRQFSMAFRTLRQYSTHIDAPKTELDIDSTIEETSDNAGFLSLVYGRPRRNTVKLLMLIDSGGSMDYYSALCSRLFKAAISSNHFKDLKVYYFHNCVYSKLYTNPSLRYRDQIDTEFVLKSVPADYKLIFVGDAAMAPEELVYRRYFGYGYGTTEGVSGMQWLCRFRDRYKHNVWLNPTSFDTDYYLDYTCKLIMKEFPMYRLTVNGLTSALKHLLGK